MESLTKYLIKHIVFNDVSFDNFKKNINIENVKIVDLQ